MEDDAGASRAIAAPDQGTIGGRTISVRLAEEKSAVKPGSGQQEPHTKPIDAAHLPSRKKRPRRPM